MADYSADVVKANRRKCTPNPGEVNMKNAAVLHDVFQRIGALDIYFGLQKDLHTHEYPFHRRQDLSEHPLPSDGAVSLNRQDDEPVPAFLQDTRDSGGSNRSLQKKFTVDELYREKLNRLQSRQPDTGECSINGMAGSISPSNAKSRDDVVDSDRNSKNATAENSLGIASRLNIDRSGSFKKEDSSNSKKPLSEGGSKRPTSSLNIQRSKEIPGEAVKAEVTTESRDAHEHKRYGSNIARQGTNVRDMDVPVYDGDVALYVGQYKEHESAKLASAKSLDMSSIHRTKSAGKSGTKGSTVKGEASSPCSSAGNKSVSVAPPQSIGDKLKRLRIGIWFQRWFVPNLSTAISCVSKMAVDMGEELQTYFTPERLVTPNRKFEEVFLSSLEYAILKDDVTRSYFQIDNDHKEHLMMREVDDFRRMYQKRRINFEDFCHHFHPYLSRRKEDYTRNKQTESREEDLQRRAIQQVLEKNIYGLSIEQPNEFFNKNCVLKPFQMLEPIP